MSIYLISSFFFRVFSFCFCDFRDSYFRNFFLHFSVQSLCQEGTENSGCDIKCIEGYTIASNTLKSKAVDFKTALETWTGNVSCTPKSCGVVPSLACEHFTHLCGTTLPGHCHLQLQIWVFSQRIALRQERVLLGVQI